MRVHFWRKDVDVNFVKTYDEEGKKMLEVQTKFMEECDDRNKECSL